MSERIWWCEAEQVGRRVRPTDPWGVHECSHKLGCMWMDMAPPEEDTRPESLVRILEWMKEQPSPDPEEPFIPDHPHSYIERYVQEHSDEDHKP